MNIGIIGGADGPTAVLVSSAFPLWPIAVAAFVAIAVTLILIVALKNKK